ncbi:unnamed protein product [Amaranthus hypochondriacus]
MISFTNKDDELISIKVQYDWKPQVCVKCNQFGHLADSCRAGITQNWVPKPTPVAPTSAPIVDEESFQLLTSRMVPTFPTTDPPPSSVFLNTSNGFEVLATHTPEIDCDTLETALRATSHPPNE